MLTHPLNQGDEGFLVHSHELLYPEVGLCPSLCLKRSRRVALGMPLQLSVISFFLCQTTAGSRWSQASVNAIILLSYDFKNDKSGRYYSHQCFCPIINQTNETICTIQMQSSLWGIWEESGPLDIPEHHWGQTKLMVMCMQR